VRTSVLSVGAVFGLGPLEPVGVEAQGVKKEVEGDRGEAGVPVPVSAPASASEERSVEDVTDVAL